MIKPLNKKQKNQRFFSPDFFKKNKKGVSPVIATILLIGIVIVIALIIFLWLRSLTQEAVTKFDKNVELVCDEVQFDASYSGGMLTVSNIGNVPIYGIKIKILQDKSFETKNLNTLTEKWPDAGLNPGKVFSDILNFEAESVTLTPILIGSAQSGEKSYACDESRYGKEIAL